MSRFSGNIGIKADAVETSPGIWESTITVTPIFGEIRNKPVRWTSGELSQDKVTANHVISIIGPESLVTDFSEAVYVTWQGKKWTVKSIAYAKPRVNLTLGGVYNG